MTFEPIWGGIIAWYLFLAGLGGGAFITSAFLKWRNPEATNMIRIGRIIAPVVVVIGLLLLMFDAKAGLFNPLRFALLLSNFGSVMTWGVVFLGAFEIIALIVAFLDIKNKPVPIGLDIAGSILSLCVAVYTGCLLGVCETFPLWNNTVLPALFLVSALSTGMAAVLLPSIYKYPDEFHQAVKLKKFHYCLPIIEVFLVMSLLFITYSDASQAGAASVMNLLAGRYAAAFWILFAIIGLIAPTAIETVLLFFSKPEFEESKKALILSAASETGVLIGGFVLRLLVLIAAMPVTIVVPWV